MNDEIRPNPNALICPVNTSVTKYRYDKLIEIKNRTKEGREMSMAEYVRLKIIYPYITRKSNK